MKTRLPLLFSIVAMIIITMASNTYGAFTLEDERKLGKETYDKLEKGHALLQTERIVEYVNRVGRIVLEQSDKQPFDYHFAVIKSDAINAFATPGGYIYVNWGLINLVENESELAGVLAHEISHVNCRHIADSIEKSQKVSIATLAGMLAGALLGGGGNLTAGLIGLSAATGASMTLKYSREHEEEADRMGLMTLAKTGYYTKSMLDFLKIMRRYEFYSNTVPSYFLTHPGTDERIRYIDASIQTAHYDGGKKSIIGGLKRIQTILLIIGSQNTEGSLKHFEEGLKKNPQDIDDLYGMAVMSARLGRTDAAITYFNRALAIDPHDADILGDLGITYFMSGKTDEALHYLSDAVKYQSSDPEALLYLGKAYEAKGDLPNAIAALKQLEEKKTDDDEFYHALAMVYGKAGNQLESHYYFGIYFKKKKKAESAIFHFKAALPLAMPGSAREKDIEAQLAELQKRKSPPPVERRRR
ncbi:MAG: Beta-barrel assembly-enhancing protease [Syntrophus sp. SKADARSKE-3]|nr:Beta-barrel assembly-enhancing protease [Syntrophus sp. SKADARSKE-3]